MNLTMRDLTVAEVENVSGGALVSSFSQAFEGAVWVFLMVFPRA